MVRLERPNPMAAVLAGLAGSAAYAGAMLADMQLTANSYDDFVLWGGMFTRDARRQRLIGIAGHCSLGVGLAASFLAARPWLPRMPVPWQAVLFTGVEHLISFPLVALGDRLHPSVRRGELPPLATGEYFLLETSRHLAYGLALGLVVATVERP